jgi:catechol-2,3-dioxygenase
MPAIGRLLQTSLYVDDLTRSIGFYQRIFGLSALMADDRFCALNVSSLQVLLLFVKHATTEPIATPGGISRLTMAKGPRTWRSRLQAKTK